MIAPAFTIAPGVFVTADLAKRLVASAAQATRRYIGWTITDAYETEWHLAHESGIRICLELGDF
jgi:hypothetical protein